MVDSVFDKTEKGREEIATRRHHLAPRLRTLLVLVDGKQGTEDLLQKVAGLGLNQTNLQELLDGGFIESVASAAPLQPPVAPAPEVARQDSFAEGAETVLLEGQTQFEAVYHFYTETIKSTIGLRGYGLQLKVEKASSIADFRELRHPYLEAVQKSKGKEIARSLRTRLDQLLYYGETAPPNTIPGIGHE
jgi:hypothetical protein